MSKHIGYVNFKDTTNSQFIYASQNYGTFYAIYACFIIEKECINEIHFELINYKGPINIGFKSKNIKANMFNMQGKTLKIALEVKGLSTIRKASVIFKTPKYKVTNINSLYFRRFLSALSNSAYNQEVFDTEFYTRSGEKNPKPTRSDNNSASINEFLNTNLLTDEITTKAVGWDCRDSNILTMN